MAVAGALMPDAHVDYGLPIGGVPANENSVIAYAVGVDIGCCMKMTVLDVPVRELEGHPERLTRAIEAETRFGVGASFSDAARVQDYGGGELALKMKGCRDSIVQLPGHSCASLHPFGH